MTGDGGGFIHRNPDSESNLQRANQRSAHIQHTKLERKNATQAGHPEQARISYTLRKAVDGWKGAPDPPEIKVRAVHPIVIKPYLAIFSS